ncbi:ceramidase [Coniochaeta sp. 2T2.1]|nr:ceramidase [Coniochaeta sp. 2T2.1]
MTANLSNASAKFTMTNFVQIPYREARDGFWGEQTSTLNWCEEDYSMTYYCAELINTLTNLIFVYLGVKGIRNCLLYSPQPSLLLSYLGYLTVSLGSMAFHATLKYQMQLADELPMIYTTCIIGYTTFAYGKGRLGSIAVAGVFVGLAWAITAYYLKSKDPVFHQVAYALMTLTLVLKGFHVMETQLRPALQKRNPAECGQILSQMWRLALAGIFWFLTGFFIWNMDNIYCPHLKTARNHVLLPWSVLLEGHGWWHLFTALGAYYFIIWRVWLIRCLGAGEAGFKLDWTGMFKIPQVIPRAAGDENLYKNTKKVQ